LSRSFIPEFFGSFLSSSIPDAAVFRGDLLAWYDESRRALPWRESTDFYRVWVSEIMLQQTRVEAAIPYYLRFLNRFPTIQALAEAPEEDVLAAWSGLGYYSRARNLRRAARRAAADGIPVTYEAVRTLPGVGPYTAAAVASIAFGEAHAAVDGNVVRVVSRLTNGLAEIGKEAERLLDRERAGDFNQAMMELGATVCVPGAPKCDVCPVLRHCAGRAAGRERELPVKAPKPAVRDVALDLLALQRGPAPQGGGEVFLLQRGAAEKRLAGFWELPEKARFPKIGAEPAGRFTHRIVNDRFRVVVWYGVWHGRARGNPEGGKWFDRGSLSTLPLATITRKALHLVHNSRPPESLEYK
jgi:A/G-specific adenine glycosylase